MMSNMRNYEDLMMEIMEEYNENPDDWTFLVEDESDTSRRRMYFSNSDDTWYIEAYKHNPHELKGKGVKFENTTISDEVDVSVSSGIRPLTQEKLKEFVEKGKIEKEEIKELMEEEPKSYDEIKNWENADGVLGPFYRSNELNLESLSKSQKKMKEKLNKEVDKLENKELSYIR